jgi:hypothetical protein
VTLIVIVVFEYKVFFYGSTAPVGLGFLVVEVSRSHSDTLYSVGLLRTSDRPVSETCTRTTQDTDKRQISMPPVGCGPTVSAGVLDRVATGIGEVKYRGFVL